MQLSRLFLRLFVIALFLPAPAYASNHTGGRLLVPQPDLDIAYISRLPRYNYDAAKNQPAAGDAVTFHAHVANRGSASTGGYAYTWYLDGAPVSSGTSVSLAAGATADLAWAWTWQNGNHFVRIDLDPGGLISEVSEQNNSLTDRTNALAVGLWVEQSVYNYFNIHQAELGLGSTSWDDWAQRQMRVWNQMFADAVTPLTPQGVLDRVRLDKVVVVADGALPSCATNFPDTSDKTVDLEWGFPAEEVGVQTGHACGGWRLYLDSPDFMNVEYSLMHELSHARYLYDLYGLNEAVHVLHLTGALNSGATSFGVQENIETDGNFTTPAYLAIDGELVVCQAKSASGFSSCARGGEGTLPRAHAAGAQIHLALVRAQDGAGSLVEGSPALPVIGWDDHLYYSRYPDDVMNGGHDYRQYSAYALNRIAGQRATCGNYNSPCNIGEYMRDLPAQNLFEIHGESGQPLQWATVEVFRPRSYPSMYGKLFLKDPDVVLTTNALGQVALGDKPFGDLSSDVGPHKGLLFLRVSSNGASEYQFFEITLANEAYWSGNHASATYILSTTLQQGPPPSYSYLPAVSLGSAGTKTLSVVSQPGDGEILNLGCPTWSACRGSSSGSFVFTPYQSGTVAASFYQGAFEIKRVFFYFDTSALPAAATIQSVTLRFYAGPYQNGSNTRVHVVKATQGSPLSANDFDQVGFASGGSALLAPNTWQAIPLGAAARAWVVKGGLTRLALVHDLDLTNTAPAAINDSNIAMSEDGSHQPELVIEYTAP